MRVVISRYIEIVYTVTAGDLVYSSLYITQRKLYNVRGMKRVTDSNNIQEVSRVRSTKHKPPENRDRPKRKLKAPFGKEQIQNKKLNPHYVSGFIDGEGCFSVSIGKHKTLKRGYEVRPEFEI